MLAATASSIAEPRRIVLLGSTGSIGSQTVDVVRRLGPDRARIIAVAAHQNISLLVEQVESTGAAYVAVADPMLGASLENRIASLPSKSGFQTVVGCGDASLAFLASLPEADTVVIAVAGAAGLRATMAAVEAGKRVCIATKEVLVAAGELVMASARKHGATILPVDSEHSAVFQCVQGYETGAVERIWLTASGGPFRTWSSDRIADATPEEALHHPIWKMGGKISVDSATLMNKGLELIEAHHLFGLPMDAIDVVLHPQSVVHSFVEMKDGALLCQMGLPDMRLPIQIALMHPEKVDAGLPRLRPDEMSDLTWGKPDHQKFPAISLARGAARIGGTAPAILNAANEAAVAAFLAGEIRFSDICALVALALDSVSVHAADTISAILAADAEARAWVAQSVRRGTMVKTGDPASALPPRLGASPA